MRRFIEWLFTKKKKPEAEVIFTVEYVCKKCGEISDEYVLTIVCCPYCGATRACQKQAGKWVDEKWVSKDQQDVS